ncbi:MAG TPA: hypothetical protein PK331_08355 [Gordonia sp. (in: high G+C Gram-positive bacteria)]|uniref:hypothetical protein n=1 Tax=unclassified Gordonia (in: high G+C Gram-positive bacteria) TaxID=2657482 RepID=UPI000FC3B733|nr:MULTISPECIES: hypothetical protein [unclassified Gordonia (in: high G+C Gram-positive bacteria)]RUP40171.1 MAG: hypothetical protein EKK60_04660 [Gordonia sp. (in: high G+C Gram-positive bacteria)]HNP55862.1 hypothetical protein [Gordonia sp. (in: high G+C Gram-positive bacteria)]HRC50915.1 hypothetical protein [Gordonia sp. (in: high G+C Gram-positive bacteria)]
MNTLLRTVLAVIIAVAGLEILLAAGRFRPYALLAGASAAALTLGALRLLVTVGAHRRSSTPADTWRDDALVRWQARTRILIDWADGSRGEWDRHLRPILAREFLMATGKRGGPAGVGRTGNTAATGLMTFGPQLWAWVDPQGADYDRRDEAGPGREVLDAILVRLEQL